MAWFSRKDKQDDAPVEGDATSRSMVSQADPEDVELPFRPAIERLGVEEQQRLAAGRAAVEKAGLDVTDLDALGAAFDGALATWQSASKGDRDDERQIVERFAIAIGEHLHRKTDLSWARVTDAFGTDLAVAGGKDDFVVVPGNLVAARWMNAESGWVPGVVGHLVRVRADR
ncbi:MAG TPA: DUF3806 domain-containing protein [Lapillicoccus sp.]|uniref:DUF3806 domain-containing protein n=1 Tax=Lapillicoccus sp. TaxID=1909287 RepID=UPI002F958B2F